LTYDSDQSSKILEINQELESEHCLYLCQRGGIVWRLALRRLAVDLSKYIEILPL